MAALIAPVAAVEVHGWVKGVVEPKVILYATPSARLVGIVKVPSALSVRLSAPLLIVMLLPAASPVSVPLRL